MTLLEIFEREIEKLGGIRATYHIIKAENSKSIKAVTDLRNYLRKSSGKPSKEWSQYEVKLLLVNSNKPSKYIAKNILTNRTHLAILQKKSRLKKAAN